MSEPNHIEQPTGDNRKHTLTEEQLIAYLEGRLPVAGQHDAEQWLAGEGMESDALEGLQNLPASYTRHTVARLNHQLQKDLKQKRKKRRNITDNKWAWLAIAVILLLAVAGCLVIKMAIK